MTTHYNPLLVVASALVAIFASYTALDLASSVPRTKGTARSLWLVSGSFAMGIGIWSMHFVGMLSFSMPGMTISYDIVLLILSVMIAVAASALALYVVSHLRVSNLTFTLAGLVMGLAICGMHYTGMASMRMSAQIEWNYRLILLSYLIAAAASLLALRVCFRLRDSSAPGRAKVQILGGVVMGIAICGMHYTGMAAATFKMVGSESGSSEGLLATSTLGGLVSVATLFVLGMALSGSIVERALTRRTTIAERNRKLYEDSENALSALKEERALRDHFVSSLTHDLRTPLTAARLNAQVLDRKLKDLEMVDRKSLYKIVENIDRADRMIHDLLDAQRISGNRPLPLERAQLDLVDLARKTIQELQTSYGDRFEFRAPALLQGAWDEGYLQRLIENLCSNAIKYGSSSERVRVSLRDLGTAIEISVRNFGELIAPEDQKNLFRLFHRSAAAQRSGQVGWGIGLTLVKGVAEAHGGSVRVESSLAGGTVFTVRLPKASQVSTASEPSKQGNVG